jgi:hypothetical protein
MGFFSIDNPILFAIALILLVALLKGFLSSRKFFRTGSRSAFVMPIVLIVALIALLYRPLLQIFAGSAAMLSMLLVFLMLLFFAFMIMGTKTQMAFMAVKEIGFLKLTVIIVVCCIFALSISQVFGERLLEEPTVSFGDAFIQETAQKELDLSPFFTPNFLGTALVLTILGMFFLYFTFQ